MSSSMHWYVPGDGTPNHNNTIKQARELGLYPSVTSVQKSWAMNSFLQAWIDKERCRNSLMYPFDPMNDQFFECREHQYGGWVCKGHEFERPNIFGTGPTYQEAVDNYKNYLQLWVDTILSDIENWNKRLDDIKWATLNKTAEFGTALHNELEHYNLDQKYKFKKKYKAHCDHWVEMFNVHVKEVVAAEIRRVCHVHKLAGAIDLTYVCKSSGLVVVADFKTRTFKKGKFNTYDKDCEQLAFYAWMTKQDLQLDYMPRIRSFGLNSAEAEPVQSTLWTEDKQERCLKFMFALAEAWRHQNNYYV